MIVSDQKFRRVYNSVLMRWNYPDHLIPSKHFTWDFYELFLSMATTEELEEDYTTYKTLGKIDMELKKSGLNNSIIVPMFGEG